MFSFVLFQVSSFLLFLSLFLFPVLVFFVVLAVWFFCLYLFSRRFSSFLVFLIDLLSSAEGAPPEAGAVGGCVMDTDQLLRFLRSLQWLGGDKG